MSRSLIIACGAALALTTGAARADSLVVCSEASPDALDANLSTANTSFDVSEQTSDRLVEMEIGGANLLPALAESWTIEDEGLRYTFKLRHGVKWQSSDKFKPTRDFSADDVVFTFNRMLDPANSYYKVGGGKYDMFASFIQPSLRAVRKVSDDTVAFELSKPSAPLLNSLSVQSFSILSAEYAAAMEKAGTPDQVDLAPIGTGPFQLVQYQKDSLIRFRAFPEFWGTKGGMPERAPKVDNLIFSITPDPSVRFAKLRANECQVARYPNPADVPQMKTTAGVTVQEATIASVSNLIFRVDRKPYSDHRVREALVSAIDLDSLVAAVYQGTGTPAGALVPPNLWSHNARLKPWPYDPAHAKALLAEAGYPNGFTADLWAIPIARAYMPNGRRAAEMIQADWAKIGVTAKIVSFEWGEYLRRLRAGEPEIAMSGGTWDYPDPDELMFNLNCDVVPSGRNLPHWCNQTYTDLVKKAQIVTNQDERAKLYEQAQQIYHDDIPAMLFADTKAYVGVRDSVRGFKLHFLGGQPFGGVSVAP